MIRRIWDITLTVKDLKKVVEFYESILGLQKKYEFKDYAGFDCGRVEWCGNIRFWRANYARETIYRSTTNNLYYSTTHSNSSRLAVKIKDPFSVLKTGLYRKILV